MENKDFFGYSRRITEPGAALPSEFATIAFGDDAAHVLLLQQFRLAYKHQVEPRYEIGSADLYWVTGQPMGEVSIGRAVGQEGFLAKFGRGTACAKVQTLSVGMKEKGGCIEAKTQGKGFNLLNCMPTQVTIDIQAGQLQMQEGISFLVGTLQAA